jgi:hypothetical protein
MQRHAVRAFKHGMRLAQCHAVGGWGWSDQSDQSGRCQKGTGGWSHHQVLRTHIRTWCIWARFEDGVVRMACPNPLDQGARRAAAPPRQKWAGLTSSPKMGPASPRAQKWAGLTSSPIMGRPHLEPKNGAGLTSSPKMGPAQKWGRPHLEPKNGAGLT